MSRWFCDHVVSLYAHCQRALQTSVVIALYTVSTSHFNMDPTLFCGIMASHGFQPGEFMPRAPGTKLPAPFDTGPPLGEALADPADSSQAQSPAARGGRSNGQQARPRGAGSGRMSKHAAHAYISRLESLGEGIVQERGAVQGLARTYPFLLQGPDELFVKDVRDLLEQYRAVVLSYEALKAGLTAEGPR